MAHFIILIRSTAHHDDTKEHEEYEDAQQSVYKMPLRALRVFFRDFVMIRRAGRKPNMKSIRPVEAA
jgi:hypothetical protein